MAKQTIGTRIKKFRLDAGLSQTDVEQITGIGKARLSRYEHDKITPTIKSIEILADAFDVAPKNLVGWE